MHHLPFNDNDADIEILIALNNENGKVSELNGVINKIYVCNSIERRRRKISEL